MMAGAPGPKGSYSLATFPGCESVYSSDGPLAGDSILVVGRLTESEKLFPRTEFAAASDYANAQVPPANLENLPATALCAAAVESVFV